MDFPLNAQAMSLKQNEAHGKYGALAVPKTVNFKLYPQERYGEDAAHSMSFAPQQAYRLST